MDNLKRIFVGIDDTDNKDTRGTGFRSRQLGKLIEDNRLGKVEVISRHQLFFDPRIPFTSQNSSACMDIMSDNKDKLTELCRNFLLEIAAEGSDVGLAVGQFDQIDSTITKWGYRAKKEVLTKEEAYKIAESKNIYLEGLTGTKDGIIGSLAALGLRRQGNDGRCIWLKGKEIRELKGVYTVDQLFEEVRIDAIIDKKGYDIPRDSKINVGEWVRPAIKNKKITIIAEKINDKNYDWEVATKEYIKSITD